MRTRHLELGRTVVIGGVPPGDWVKARGVWSAAQHTDAEIVVISDADVWCDGIDDAVQAVAHGAPWAIPHRMVRRLTETASADTIRTGVFDGDLEQKPYVGLEGGGLVVLRRSDLLDVPPDPRFVGWGQEDESWGLALAGLLGDPWRGDADLWHLWHPPQPRLNRKIGSKASKALWARYRTGERRDRAALAALAVEAKAALLEAQ